MVKSNFRLTGRSPLCVRTEFHSNPKRCPHLIWLWPYRRYRFPTILLSSILPLVLEWKQQWLNHCWIACDEFVMSWQTPHHNQCSPEKKLWPFNFWNHRVNKTIIKGHHDIVGCKNALWSYKLISISLSSIFVRKYESCVKNMCMSCPSHRPLSTWDKVLVLFRIDNFLENTLSVKNRITFAFRELCIKAELLQALAWCLRGQACQTTQRRIPSFNTQGWIFGSLLLTRLV